MEFYAERFHSKYKRLSPNDCWEWQAYVNPENGYGTFCICGNVYAHRVAYMLAHPDEDISDLLICHTCDNKICMNPAHLFKGTHIDNARDMVQKGRNRNQNMGKTHCKNGHEFTTENTYVSSNGKRSCRICRCIIQIRYNYRKTR